VTRISKDESAPVPGEAEPPGGRAAERLREFERARGLGVEDGGPTEDERQDGDDADQGRDERTEPGAVDDGPGIDDADANDRDPRHVPPRDAASEERRPD
jgi:hypothetical protein